MRTIAAILVGLTACAEPATSTETSALTTAVRHERYGLIRDAAAEMGLYNAALMAGIAISETNLAHCQSEATYACMGPASPSCDGGPIIAGAADGPCSAMQGGLGMFQFDAGTYADTVAAYGDSILTIEGNTAQAVDFVVKRLQQSVSGVDGWLGATGWMNNVPMMAGDPVMEQWASFLACRYNGCCTTSSTCLSRGAGYRDNALMAFEEMGADFWRTADRCAAIPDGGVIDQRSTCYIAAGDPRYWHRETGGYNDTREWTGTTSQPMPANFAQWLIKAKPGRYSIEVNLDGGEFGQSKQAHYDIQHAGALDTVTVDQSAATGWVSLGEFDFAGEGDEHVQLGDNTGEAGSTNTHLLFDAIRVLSLDDPGAGGGCCDASGQGGPTALLGLALVTLTRPRRARRA